jgi:C1A family cysteine protease
MKFILVFIAFASLAESFSNYNEFKVNHKSVVDYAIHNGFPDFEKNFSEFKVKFNKIYNSNEELELRKFNFLNSLKAIEQNRQQYLNGHVLHRLAVNHLSDLSESEYSLMLNGSPIHKNSEYYEEEEVSQSYEKLPQSFDWREKGCVTSIKNQGECGSCWAFATIATIESAYAIKNNVTLDLSEQELVDCSSVGKYHSQGCNYGFNDQAFQYVIDEGVVDETVYPYVHKQNKCPNSVMNSTHKKWFINKYKVLRFNATDEEIMSTILNSGPVTVQINADGNDFEQYQ